jgi:hypothetical protein
MKLAAVALVAFTPLFMSSLSACVVEQDDAEVSDVAERSDAIELQAHKEKPPRPPRGVWFWREDGQYNGAGAIVGDSVRETQTLATFATYGFRRIYGSYDWTSSTAETDIASWNAQLAASSRSRTLLMSENTWIDSANWPNLQTKLQDRVVDFNTSVSTNEQFTAVHFDIEPHALPSWSGLSESGKRAALGDLLDTFQMIRSYLDSQGATTIRIYADLPVWFDNLPPALGGTGSVGWTSTSDRQDWWNDLGVAVNGITLMAFERDTLSSITNAVTWEIDNFPREVRVGIEVDIGPTKTWPSFNAMLAMASLIEAPWSLNKGVDFQSYRLFKSAIPLKPWPALHVRSADGERPGKARKKR